VLLCLQLGETWEGQPPQNLLHANSRTKQNREVKITKSIPTQVHMRATEIRKRTNFFASARKTGSAFAELSVKVDSKNDHQQDHQKCN
jgi:hypothetical protein